MLILGLIRPVGGVEVLHHEERLCFLSLLLRKHPRGPHRPISRSGRIPSLECPPRAPGLRATGGQGVLWIRFSPRETRPLWLLGDGGGLWLIPSVWNLAKAWSKMEFQSGGILKR